VTATCVHRIPQSPPLVSDPDIGLSVQIEPVRLKPEQRLHNVGQMAVTRTQLEVGRKRGFSILHLQLAPCQLFATEAMGVGGRA